MNKRLALLLCVFTLSACQLYNREPIKIGYIGPLTGEAASYGIDTINGVKLSIEEINAKGGIKGRPVTLLVEDTRCVGIEAAHAARKLIHVDKVSAIIGGQCSGETLAAAPIAEKAHIPMISPVSSSPEITNAGDFIFRVYPSDALKTKMVAKYLQDRGYEKVALVSERTDFAMDFRDSLKRNIGAENIAFDAVVEPGTKDFDDLMENLEDTSFDVFFPNVQSDAVMAKMVLALRAHGFLQPILTHDVGDSTTLGERATEAVEGMHVITVPTSGDKGVFAVMYVEKLGVPQQALPFAAHAYDATNVLLQAITEVGTDGKKIRDYLYDLETYEGVIGPFRFSPEGDVQGIPFALKEFKNGKMVTIEQITPWN